MPPANSNEPARTRLKRDEEIFGATLKVSPKRDSNGEEWSSVVRATSTSPAERRRNAKQDDLSDDRPASSDRRYCPLGVSRPQRTVRKVPANHSAAPGAIGVASEPPLVRVDTSAT
jgi:hypothetical protein